ncbi:RNA polymerase sigma factor [Sphingomonas gei]|nr:RNA polymerase sigma factor [Sphingomonas gei]
MQGSASQANTKRRLLAQWMATGILPHEPQVRLWLRRYRISREDADEIVQDAYCAIARLDSFDHIDRPDAYFFAIVRNLMLRRIRRRRVVQIDMVAEIESYVDDDRPSPEREVAAKLDWARVLGLIADLPERCRQAVHLRKVEGWSQRRIAEHMNITEAAVEKQIWLGIKALRAAWDRGPFVEEAASDAKRVERRS